MTSPPHSEVFRKFMEFGTGNAPLGQPETGNSKVCPTKQLTDGHGYRVGARDTCKSCWLKDDVVVHLSGFMQPFWRPFSPEYAHFTYFNPI